GKGAKEVGKGIIKQTGKKILKEGAEKVASAGKSVFKTAAKDLSEGASRAVNMAIQAGKSKDEIMAIVKADAKGAFERIGKTVTKDAETRAAGNTVIGKQVATAGRSIRDSVRTPRAQAAEFTPETKNFSSLTDTPEASVSVSRGTKEGGDTFVRATEKDASKVIDEAPKAPEKPVIERTKVARLNERADALKAKVAKAVEDSKKAADDGVILDKNPIDEVDNDLNDFKKEFEELTGEKAPDDPDELMARIRGIEEENKGAWLKEDKRVTRGKELSSLAGVRRGQMYARGGKASHSGKFKGKTGVFKTARRKTLIKQDTENYKRSLLATLSQRATDIRRELAVENARPKLNLDRIQKLQDELDQDIPMMHKDIRTNKLTDEDLFNIGENMTQKGRDPFKVQRQGERAGTLPTPSVVETIADLRKKGNGAVRQTVPESRGSLNVSDSEVKRVAGNLKKNNPGLGDTEAEAMARDVISNRPFNKPKVTFERAKNLSPGSRAIEDKAFKKVAEKEDEMLADYTAKHGKFVNADNFRPFFKGEGYAGHNAEAVQEPASYLAKRAYTKGLENDGEFATLYAGGSGTGKTSALKGIPEASETVKN
ncbi:MAG: hypothetical protein ACEQSB_06775, partial [Undibacterium sp.]